MHNCFYLHTLNAYQVQLLMSPSSNEKMLELELFCSTSMIQIDNCSLSSCRIPEFSSVTDNYDVNNYSLKLSSFVCNVAKRSYFATNST